jgi:hypothetical protein
VLCYVTFEVLVGIGVGLLSDEVNALPTPEQAAGAKVVDRIFIASGGSIVERVVGAVTRIVVGAAGAAVVLAGAAPTTAAA